MANLSNNVTKVDSYHFKQLHSENLYCSDCKCCFLCVCHQF